jgi:hypothetical protein
MVRSWFFFGTTPSPTGTRIAIPARTKDRVEYQLGQRHTVGFWYHQDIGVLDVARSHDSLRVQDAIAQLRRAERFLGCRENQICGMRGDTRLVRCETDAFPLGNGCSGCDQRPTRTQSQT